MSSRALLSCNARRLYLSCVLSLVLSAREARERSGRSSDKKSRTDDIVDFARRDGYEGDKGRGEGRQAFGGSDEGRGGRAADGGSEGSAS